MIPREKPQDLPLWANAESKPKHAGTLAALFDAEHPGIYIAFSRIALAGIAEGKKHWSADAIMQIMRHETGIKDGDPHLKINNHHRAYLSRRFMAEHPQHSGFFAVRESRSERAA